MSEHASGRVAAAEPEPLELVELDVPLELPLDEVSGVSSSHAWVELATNPAMSTRSARAVTNIWRG